MKTQKQNGFTLIELLVVISIIGILSSVVLTSLSGTKEKAKLARYKSDLHQAELFLEMYYIEYGGYPYGSSGGLYCIAASSASEQCMIGGSSTGILNISSAGNGTITAYDNPSEDNLAAIVAPKLKNDITLGSGSGQYRGIIYQSCSSPTTINGVSVCTVQNVNDLGNPKIIYPVLESSSVVVKIKVAGTNSPDNYSGGSQ